MKALARTPKAHMKNISRKENQLDYLYPEPDSYLDCQDFQDYTDSVRQLLERIGPATTRTIKKALAKKYQERFNLLDVLESIGVEKSWVIKPTKYSLLPKRTELPKLDWMNRPVGI